MLKKDLEFKMTSMMVMIKPGLPQKKTNKDDKTKRLQQNSICIAYNSHDPSSPTRHNQKILVHADIKISKKLHN